MSRRTKVVAIALIALTFGISIGLALSHPAARVGLAPSTCLGRVRALQARGIIQGYEARINEKLLRGASGTDTADVVAVGSRSAETGRPEPVSQYA